MERRIFPNGKDASGTPYEYLRWSRFNTVGKKVFPFLPTLGKDGSTYSANMEGARFTIPRANLLAKVVNLIDGVTMDDRDTKGDIYEYMLGKIAQVGSNDQFRTPRHFIRLMIELTAPTATEILCDRPVPKRPLGASARRSVVLRTRVWCW